jgi:hypothetical protein
MNLHAVSCLPLQSSSFEHLSRGPGPGGDSGALYHSCVFASPGDLLVDSRPLCDHKSGGEAF